MRHQQLKQHPAKLGLVLRHANLLSDKRFQQTRLAVLYDGFGAGALADVHETQPFGNFRFLPRLAFFALPRHAGGLLGKLLRGGVGVGDHHARPVGNCPIIIKPLPHAHASIQLLRHFQPNAELIDVQLHLCRQIGQGAHGRKRAIEI